MAALYKSFHNADHLVDVFRRAGIDRRPFYAQRIHHLEIILYVTFGHLPNSDVSFFRTRDYLVVDVREILYVINLITFVFEIPANHVETNVRARMPYVALVVNGHPAHIHVHSVARNRNELLLRPRQVVRDSYPSVHSLCLHYILSKLPFLCLITHLL